MAFGSLLRTASWISRIVRLSLRSLRNAAKRVREDRRCAPLAQSNDGPYRHRWCLGHALRGADAAGHLLSGSRRKETQSHLLEVLLRFASVSESVRFLGGCRFNAVVSWHQRTARSSDCCSSNRETGAIAEVLGALDDKIRLNRKLNRSMEALASSSFRSWFVDFDPVRGEARRKSAGRLAGRGNGSLSRPLRGVRARPDSPGLAASTIGAEVTVVGGSTPSTNEPRFWNGDVCFVTPRDLSRLDDPVILDTERHITQRASDRSVLDSFRSELFSCHLARRLATSRSLKFPWQSIRASSQ